VLCVLRSTQVPGCGAACCPVCCSSVCVGEREGVVVCGVCGLCTGGGSALLPVRCAQQQEASARGLAGEWVEWLNSTSIRGKCRAVLP